MHNRGVNNFEELKNLEKQINDRIKNYFSLIDNNITKLNIIADELNILKNIKNRNTIHISSSYVILNKNSNKLMNLEMKMII